MRLLRPKRVGSYVRFQWLPKWTESGELVALEFVRASYNGNDNGVVTIERLKPQPIYDAGRGPIPTAILDLCQRRRAVGPTPCHYPACDCTTEHEVEIRRQRDDAIRQRADELTKEWAAQDRWDNANLSRQGRSCEVNLFAPEYVADAVPLRAVETNGDSFEIPRGPRPYHVGRVNLAADQNLRHN